MVVNAFFGEIQTKKQDLEEGEYRKSNRRKKNARWRRERGEEGSTTP